MRSNRAPAIAVAGILLFFLSCSRRPSAPGAAPASTASGLTLPPEQRSRVALQRVQESVFRRTIEATGTVAFDQTASTQVIAAISGPVARILTPPGTRVEPGQSLAEVTSPDFAAAVSGYRKSFVTAANLRRIADLDNKLFDAGGISRREMQQAETEALSAEADRDSALAQLRSIGIPEETIRALQDGRPTATPHGVIRSPISGTVVERLINPGQLLQAGATVCFTIADLSKIWVIANVFERDIASVAAGDSATVTAADASTPIPGRVDYIASLVDPTTRAIGVRIVLRNPGQILKRDQYVHVAILSARESRGILVPAAALLRDDENLPYVYVQDAGGAFLRRRVEIGGTDNGHTEVHSGIRPGESVVTDGALFMQFAESQ